VRLGTDARELDRAGPQSGHRCGPSKRLEQK
jgi:hypothetical protein